MNVRVSREPGTSTTIRIGEKEYHGLNKNEINVIQDIFNRCLRHDWDGYYYIEEDILH